MSTQKSHVLLLPGFRFMFYRLLLSCALLLFSTEAGGQERVLQLAVVNMQKVLNSSSTGRDARKKLEQQVAASQAYLDKLGAELQQLQQDISKQAVLLSAEAMQERQQQFQARQRDLQRAYQDEQDKLVHRRSAVLDQLVSSIEKLVSQIAEKEGYQFILDLDGRLVIYASQRVDLTDQIIRALDRN